MTRRPEATGDGRELGFACSCLRLGFELLDGQECPSYGRRRRRKATRDRLADELGPVLSTCGARCSDKGCLPMTLEEYLELLDWTGRQVAPGKRGSIPADKPPILERLGFKTDNWLRLTKEFSRLFHRVAGRRENVDRERNRRTKGSFHPGAAELFS